jgi:hypothetical protein
LKLTTVVIDNHGIAYDLGAGDRVPKSLSTWGINAFTCPESGVSKFRSAPKCVCCGKIPRLCSCMID